MRTIQRALVATLLALLVLGLAACGGDDGDTSSDDSTTSAQPDDETTTTTAATTTTAPVPVEDQVWGELTAAMQAVATVSAAPDPDAPELVRHFTGESLAGIQSTMRDLAAGGSGANTAIEPHRYSVTVVGDTATVDYCYTSNTTYLDTAGQASGGVEVTSMRGTAQMQRIDDVWKIAQQTFSPEECPAS
jgi:hypothetical protein